MSESDENQVVRFHEDTSSVLGRTLQCLAEGLTGLAASDKKELALSVGHIFQGLRKGQFLSQFSCEWEAFKEKGQIKEDYENTEQHFSCLQELLEFLDRDLPDQIRFETLKKVFFVAATDTDTNKDSLLPHQYMRVCRSLSTGEIIVLSTTYKISNSQWTENLEATKWLNLIARESGLTHSALVEIHEEALMGKKLITPRTHNDRSGVNLSPHFRLTDLGYELCCYIDKYKAPEATNSSSTET